MGEELEALAFGYGPHLLESKYPTGAGPGVLLGTPSHFAAFLAGPDDSTLPGSVALSGPALWSPGGGAPPPHHLVPHISRPLPAEQARALLYCGFEPIGEGCTFPAQP